MCSTSQPMESSQNYPVIFFSLMSFNLKKNLKDKFQRTLPFVRFFHLEIISSNLLTSHLCTCFTKIARRKTDVSDHELDFSFGLVGVLQWFKTFSKKLFFTACENLISSPFQVFQLTSSISGHKSEDFWYTSTLQGSFMFVK